MQDYKVLKLIEIARVQYFYFKEIARMQCP